MKYLIDLTSLSNENTGIEYVAKNASISLINNCSNIEFFLVFNNFIPETIECLLNKPNISYVDLKTHNWILLRFYKLPNIIRRVKADLNLFFAFPCPYFAPHDNAITLIHDLTPFLFPKTQTFLQNVRWKAMLKKCIKKDKHILTVTDTIKYEIANNFSRGDAKRIYPGIKNPLEHKNSDVLIRNNLEKNKYILSVGTFEPRKNFTLLLEAFNELVREEQLDYKLVIVGKEGWKFKKLKSTKMVVLLPYIKDVELSELYKNAKLFVSPSIYEGFGLPVIEAANHNLHILVSDIPTYRETTQNNATYFNPDNKNELKAKILECVSKSDFLQIDTKKFNWDNYGTKLCAYLSQNNKYLSVCTSNLQLSIGQITRIMQYYFGLENFHFVDKYVGNSNVHSYIGNLKDLFTLAFEKQCSIRKNDVWRIKQLIKTGKYTSIFFDSSMYGNLYKKIKKQFPDLQIITHFHNCEYKFLFDMYLYYMSSKCTYWKKIKIWLMSKISLPFLKISEELACKYSDKVIFISDTDKKQFPNVQNKSIVIPPCIEDKLSRVLPLKFKFDYVMFVGSNFYANIEAINFLNDKVAPFINKKIIILSDYVKRIENEYSNLQFETYSENYKEVFSNAVAFVSPIFSGSGSKIKIVEALMWGKKLISTHFSLYGYNYQNADVDICESSEEFIEAINKCDNKNCFSETNRNLYLNNYDMKSNLKYFKDV